MIGVKEVLIETIVKAFCWAQWDAIHQSLYFIHNRKPLPVSDEDEIQDDPESAPTLSALQFHDDMPHETVVNNYFQFIYGLTYLLQVRCDILYVVNCNQSLLCV